MLRPVDRGRPRAALCIHHSHQDVFAGLVTHLPEGHRRSERDQRLLVVQQVAQVGGQVGVPGLPRRQRRRSADVHIRIGHHIDDHPRRARAAQQTKRRQSLNPRLRLHTFHVAGCIGKDLPRLDSPLCSSCRGREGQLWCLQFTARRRAVILRSSALRLPCRIHHASESKQNKATPLPVEKLRSLMVRSNYHRCLQVRSCPTRSHGDEMLDGKVIAGEIARMSHELAGSRGLQQSMVLDSIRPLLH